VCVCIFVCVCMYLSRDGVLCVFVSSRRGGISFMMTWGFLPCKYVCVYIYIYIYIYICIYMYIYICVCVCVCGVMLCAFLRGEAEYLS
jgi:hypothetical protein